MESLKVNDAGVLQTGSYMLLVGGSVSGRSLDSGLVETAGLPIGSLSLQLLQSFPEFNRRGHRVQAN